MRQTDRRLWLADFPRGPLCPPWLKAFDFLVIHQTSYRIETKHNRRYLQRTTLDPPRCPGHSGSPNPRPDLPRVVPPVNPVEFAPLAGRQRPQNRVVHDFRPVAEPALAVIQTWTHLLQFKHDGLLRL